MSSMSLDEKRAASRGLSQNLAEFLPNLNSNPHIGDMFKNDKLLGGFSPLDDELEWHALLKESHWRPCVPSIFEDGSMEFYKISWKLLAKAFMGLTISNAFPRVDPSVLVVPGLAFSKEGKRLGRGKGFYDRYLENKTVFKIGVCAEKQVVDELKTEDHDVRMDIVITEKNIYKG